MFRVVTFTSEDRKIALDNPYRLLRLHEAEGRRRGTAGRPSKKQRSSPELETETAWDEETEVSVEGRLDGLAPIQALNAKSRLGFLPVKKNAIHKLMRFCSSQ